MTSEKISLKKLAELLSGRAYGDDLSVSSITLDSRLAKPGALFAVIAGNEKNGEEFVLDAKKRGASALLTSNPSLLGNLPGIEVSDVRLATSRAAALLTGEPSKKICLIGVTGTNGKSTITWLIFHLLRLSGLRAARIGTLGIESPSGLAELALTTPDAVFLQESMRRFADEGVTHCVMEVSSHALDQKRAEDLHFDAAVFTNLTHDHLDYHGDLESYFTSKVHLFRLLESSCKTKKIGISNIGDPYGRKIQAMFPANSIHDFSFDSGSEAPLGILDFAENREGSCLKISAFGRNFNVTSSFIGSHNAENIAAAFGVWLGLGLESDKFVSLLPEVPQVPGRLERVESGEGAAVFVDYAHSPDALGRVLKALKPSTPGNLTVVFGCGGDRDRSKRRVMGEIAAAQADRVIVTSDNPRTEDPDSIIAEIVAGVGSKPVTVISDRKAAIREAIFHARMDDTVLIAGKGHENYQIIGKERFPFSDQEEASRALKELFCN